MEEAKKTRSARKSALSRCINDIHRFIVEGDSAKVKERLESIKEKFDNFENAHDAYHDKLEGLEDIENSDDYYTELHTRYVMVIKEGNEYLKVNEDIKEAKESKPVDSSSDDKMSHKDFAKYFNLPGLTLPTYEGDPLGYHNFMALFDDNVDSVYDCNKTKLSRLIQFTGEKVQKAIMPCSAFGAEGYAKARKILQERYGNDHLIAEKVISNLKSYPSVKTAEELQKFSDELQNCYVTLSSVKQVNEVDTQSCIVNLVSKLQPYIRNKWRDFAFKQRDEKSRYPDFSEFVEFISKQAANATDPVYGSSMNIKDSTSKEGTSHPRSKVLTSQTDVVKRVYECILCRENHRLFYCQQFKEMKPHDRLSLVVQHKLCKNCLLDNHSTANCRKNSVCSVPGCGRRHTKFIHVNHQSDESDNDSQPEQSIRLVNATVNVSSGIHMPVVAVKVNDAHQVCALLDTGSSNTFCSKSLMKALKMKGSPITYSLSTLSSEREVKSKAVDLKVSSLDGQESLHMSNVYVTDKIPVRTSCPNFDKYPHFKGLQFVAGGQNIEMLIGQDNAEALCPLDVKRGKLGEPFACKTLFGWSINGPERVSDPVNSQVISNFINSAPADNVVQMCNSNAEKSENPIVQKLHVESVINVQESHRTSIDKHSHIIGSRNDDVLVPKSLVVANHTSVDCQESNVEQGHHAAGSQNPADLMKMQDVESIDLNKRLKGQEFQCDREFQHVDVSQNEQDPVVKCEIHTNVSVIDDVGATEKLFEYFSDWHRLKRVVGWIRKFIDYLGGINPTRKSSLLASDLEGAEIAITDYVQRRNCESELNCLKLGNNVLKSSHISDISPVLDENGLSTVDGHVHHPFVSSDSMQLYVFPHSHIAARHTIAEYMYFGAHFWHRAGGLPYQAEIQIVVKDVSNQWVRCRKLFASQSLESQEVDFSQVRKFCSMRGVEWKFNPPGVTHIGGTWERFVCVVKKIVTGLF